MTRRGPERLGRQEQCRRGQTERGVLGARLGEISNGRPDPARRDETGLGRAWQSKLNLEREYMAGKMNNEQIETELQALMARDPNGLLRPDAIVEVARDPSNIFHDKFTWDDTEAAEKYRLQEATQLIQSFKVKIPELKLNVRALTSLDLDRKNGGGFRWMIDSMARPELRENMIQTALRELEVLRKRYAHIEELAEVWNTLDQVEAVDQQIARSVRSS